MSEEGLPFQPDNALGCRATVMIGIPILHVRANMRISMCASEASIPSDRETQAQTGWLLKGVLGRGFKNWLGGPTRLAFRLWLTLMLVCSLLHLGLYPECSTPRRPLVFPSQGRCPWCGLGFPSGLRTFPILGHN